MTGTVKKRAMIRPVIVVIGIVLLAIALRYLALEEYGRRREAHLNANPGQALSVSRTEDVLTERQTPAVLWRVNV